MKGNEMVRNIISQVQQAEDSSGSQKFLSRSRKVPQSVKKFLEPYNLGVTFSGPGRPIIEV